MLHGNEENAPWQRRKCSMATKKMLHGNEENAPWQRRKCSMATKKMLHGNEENASWQRRKCSMATKVEWVEWDREFGKLFGAEFTSPPIDVCVSNSSCEKILGVYFDNKLNFNTHVTKLCKKASQKLHALARVSNLMSFRQRRIIMNAFISSQFCYCPLLRMCHSRLLNTQINKIHERALHIVYKDNISSFEFLLEKSGSVKIHYRNLQYLAVEIYKALNNLSSPLMSELFRVKNMKYNLRNGSIPVSSNSKTECYGKGCISYLATIIWNQVPEEIKKL